MSGAHAEGETISNSSALPTVRAVLGLPIVRRAVPEIVSGAQALDREIRWVHAGEVPHIAQMLKGGELLLTTGMGIGPSDAKQRRFVRDLVERGAAALAIELGTAFGSLPPALADEANRRGLPMIAFHHEVRFVEITEAVHREIVSRQLELMRRGDRLQRRLTSLMLDGGGVPEVLAELSEAIGNPVVLEKTDHGLFFHATDRAGDPTVLAAWDAFARGFDDAPSAVQQIVPMGGAETWGRLVALAVDSELNDHDRVAIERAVGIVALALLRDREEDAVGSRERGNFLGGLLDREVDDAEVRTRVAAMGFDRSAPLLLPVAIARSPTLANRAEEETSWALVWRDLQRELTGRRVGVIAGTREHERELLMVLSLRNEAARPDLAQRVARIVRDGTTRHLGSALAAVVCVGPVAHSWRGAAEGLGRAVEALAGAAHAQVRLWHDATEPDLDRLLWSLRDRPELRRFSEARLAPLVEHDRRRRSKLLPTLVAFCEHGGRKAETARALHIERQSLYHRLSRIERLLRADLSDGGSLLGLHLAVRARGSLDSAAS